MIEWVYILCQLIYGYVETDDDNYDKTETLSTFQGQGFYYIPCHIYGMKLNEIKYNGMKLNIMVWN